MEDFQDKLEREKNLKSGSWKIKLSDGTWLEFVNVRIDTDRSLKLFDIDTDKLIFVCGIDNVISCIRMEE